ncbi:RNA polymerase sigma factor (plasmid) [Streptomyces sp. BI20]|uniref:RNA polymerase sigma factor n=1 Tax=Streptomyces sp. BI20 TaxID=3403460 RepID=UPI003C71A1FE
MLASGPAAPPSDMELTHRAQAGETAALGLLLARHQASMRAVALSLLGHGPDVDDAVQEAALAALSRIGDVRDGAVVGAWLRAIVRNAARTRLRAARELTGLDGLDGFDHLRSREDAWGCPERRIEEHAMRDWIWEAVEGLPEHLRLVVMLRHFSGTTTSYQEIANACEIPVGTVRSRLNHARARMARALEATAAGAHGDAGAVADASRAEVVATLRAWESGGLPREISELWPAEAEMIGRLGRPGERLHPVPIMRYYLEDGVRQHVRHVVAGRDIAVWEMDVTHDGAAHVCPPHLSWLMFRRGGRVERLRVVFPRPSR